ncbi:general transcription factor IIH subunit 2-like [Varroa jacobsoni]|uniref:General transcription factor IIH subunit n=1 Tax=Varroa destructor TaxID=109461 RepID=A0A7M7JLX1_VARDE|nr:general transcription factor IIH subunit 2-like [Varroa destructor]XP_022649375.1 general transcription factor IIH subunit 2-like [Varroa destructor]XP_022692789.1 general transcription factor IIH subunit 2-like [Varroa jacobsoni]
MAEEEEQQGYRWESEYERTWEAIQEDESGNLQASVQDIVHKTRRHHLLLQKNVRLGMMRHIYIVLDLSSSMNDTDLKPTRMQCVLHQMENFVDRFYDENPISQMAIVATSNKRAEKISDLSGNPLKHKEGLAKLKDRLPVGEPSLQNSINMAANVLQHMPAHSSRELIIILGSLTTCDPSDIGTTISEAKQLGLRCSVIGLAAEVHVCRQLTKTTGGSYQVVMDEEHLGELLSTHLLPPPALSNVECSLVRMGFPYHRSEHEDAPSLCHCHLESASGDSGHHLSSGGYFCPQCKSKYCELPVECRCCGLTLVSAPHLARSYHHLFPLDNFEETPLQKGEVRTCFACMCSVEGQSMYKCGSCHEFFCLDCDIFVHSTLHVCPGCACKPLVTTGGTASSSLPLSHEVASSQREH